MGCTIWILFLLVFLNFIIYLNTSSFKKTKIFRDVLSSLSSEVGFIKRYLKEYFFLGWWMQLNPTDKTYFMELKILQSVEKYTILLLCGLFLTKAQTNKNWGYGILSVIICICKKGNTKKMALGFFVLVCFVFFWDREMEKKGEGYYKDDRRREVRERKGIKNREGV